LGYRIESTAASAKLAALHMPLPAEVLAARERMREAEDELRADIENDEPYDAMHRRRLLDNLREAMLDYLSQMARLSR
jgi:hypothetical protein